MNRESIGKATNVCRTLKCRLQYLSELHGMPETKSTRSHVVRNASHFAH